MVFNKSISIGNFSPQALDPSVPKAFGPFAGMEAGAQEETPALGDRRRCSSSVKTRKIEGGNFGQAGLRGCHLDIRVRMGAVTISEGVVTTDRGLSSVRVICSSNRNFQEMR